MVRADDVFPIKYYDAGENLMRNLQKQEEYKILIQREKKEKLNKIIKMMGHAFYEAEANSACETYCGHAIDLLKEFRDKEL